MTFSAKEVTALGMTEISTGLKEAHFMATREGSSLEAPPLAPKHVHAEKKSFT